MKIYSRSKETKEKLMNILAYCIIFINICDPPVWIRCSDDLGKFFFGLIELQKKWRLFYPNDVIYKVFTWNAPQPSSSALNPGL